MNRTAGRAAVLALAAAGAIAGCVIVGAPGEPAPTDEPPNIVEPTPGGPTLDDPAVSDFYRRCADGVESWQRAQLDFPKTLTLDYPEAVTYHAAVDASAVPAVPDEVIDVGDGVVTSRLVMVQCRLAARLDPVGEHVKVEEPDGDSPWVRREWAPNGVVEWTWTITVDKPANQQVRLSVRPAVVLEGEGVVYGAENEVVATSRIEVHASRIERAAQWVSAEIAGLVVALGGLVVAVGVVVGGVKGWFKNKDA